MTTISVVKGTKTEISPGVWRLRVYAGRRANGTPIQITKTVRAPDKNPKPGAGSRIADDELAKMVSKVAQGDTATSIKTVGELLTEWLAHCESLGRSPTTMREYNRLTEQTVRPEIGHLRLSKLSTRDLDRLYAKLTEKGNKATTVRRVHALIGAALRQAERWEYVGQNVARRASPPPVHAAQVEAPTPDEVQAILVAAEAVEPTLAVLLLLAALTGARRGELCALRWPDIDFDAGTLTIARSIYEVAGGGWAEKGTKTHQARTIGLDDLGLEALRRHRSAVDALADILDLEVLPDGFVFSRSPVGAEPIRPDVVTKFMTRAAKKAGVDTHVHALRHFSATQGIAAGYDPVTVSSRLGHADPSITLRVYSHVLEQRDKELAAAVGRTLALPSGENPRVVS
jgi:integrase